MKSRRLLIQVVIAAAIPILCAAIALAGRGMGGWEPGSGYDRMYDPKTVETVRGEVISVDKIVPRKGMSYGLHAVLKTDKEEISVHIGPGWYLEKQAFKLAKGDTIEVKGSRITYEEKPAIIAAKVRKGDTRIKLRDENGVPAWSGGRR
jgi:hypothetical protein